MSFVPKTPVIFETIVDMLVSIFGLLFFSVARIFHFGELVIVDATPSLNEENQLHVAHVLL